MRYDDNEIFFMDIFYLISNRKYYNATDFTKISCPYYCIIIIILCPFALHSNSAKSVVVVALLAHAALPYLETSHSPQSTPTHNY